MTGVDIIRNMKNIRSGLLGLVLVGALLVVAAEPVAAIDVVNDSCSSVSNSVCDAQGDDIYDLVGNIISILLYAIGVVAVIMIVIGGISYVTSNGDSNKISQAKNTILYSVIGLVVAILGQAIVLFVTGWFT